MQKSAVIGATGTIGKAIAQLLKDSGHEVVAASRNGENQIDIDNPKSIEQFFSKTGTLDNIVCAAGNASFGMLNQLTDEQINLSLNSKLLGQVNVVRKGLQFLKPNGTIILTGGILAHHPGPATSAIALVNAGLEGFVRAVALELSEGRKILIAHPPFVQETAQAMGMPSDQLPPATVVAESYLQGLQNQNNGEIIYVK
jgi:NAD(P)-dependent dehydrogenase (short-subunit alcohol dehydrogenase family)